MNHNHHMRSFQIPVSKKAQEKLKKTTHSMPFFLIESEGTHTTKEEEEKNNILQNEFKKNRGNSPNVTKKQKLLRKFKQKLELLLEIKNLCTSLIKFNFQMCSKSNKAKSQAINVFYIKSEL
eukprot:TRINITY_DN1447_c0_g1_i10.p6 TRINITY_DN1447_c0_g1~~TRINITY_DN1447_c0_g1_i10.p6  ORF type:complete len:122 (-),score=6.63 TRINITY_DN1447_c0_g1_i10:205-570(-)